LRLLRHLLDKRLRRLLALPRCCGLPAGCCCCYTLSHWLRLLLKRLP
jgi:hypothetical protein